MRRFGPIFALSIAVGCGGHVEEKPGNQQAAGTAGATAEDDPWAGAPLGACKPGFEPGNETCFWRSNGLCYATKHDACNCACPKDRDSICFSSYPDDGSPVEVSCL
jgi:hypothetical protein